jgi:hypothetical protein
LDDDGTRNIRIFFHELGKIEQEDEEQVSRQEQQHRQEGDGKTKHKQTDNRFPTGEYL